MLSDEYFRGETGPGLGARHQTSWTALVAKLIEETPRFEQTDPVRRRALNVGCGSIAVELLVLQQVS